MDEKDEMQLPPDQFFQAPQSHLPSPAALSCSTPHRGAAAVQGQLYLQHTQAVDSWDALTVPQQVAAINARCQQQFLPSLTSDAPMVDGQRIHVGAVSQCGQLSLSSSVVCSPQHLCLGARCKQDVFTPQKPLHKARQR